MAGGADLRQADLRGARLEGADLANADLTGANARGALLASANLTGARLAGADLNGARCDRRTRWPPGFDPRQHGAVEMPGPGAVAARAAAKVGRRPPQRAAATMHCLPMVARRP
jgi:hypothetical protein